MHHIDETYVISYEAVVIDNEPKDIPSVKYVEKLIKDSAYVPKDKIIDVPPQRKPISLKYNESFFLT